MYDPTGVARHDRTVRLETVKRSLAGSRRGVALKILAERHGWPLRTLYRDIEALELAGYAVIRDEGRFRLEDHGPGMAGAPTADERLALYLAREGAKTWKHTSLGRALDRLWNRVSSSGGPQAALFPIDGLPWLSISERSAIDYGRQAQIVNTLERAVRDRFAVLARYRAISTRQITSRVIEPGELHYDPGLGSLYLIGWCRLRNDVRIFAVHRFMAATTLAERCPPRAETRSLAALRRAFRVWRSTCVEPVRIWFGPEVADEIRERQWIPEQHLEPAEGGAVVLGGEVAGLAEVERWVLGYGPAARALAPVALINAIKQKLRQGAALYQAPGRAPSGSLSLVGKGRG